MFNKIKQIKLSFDKLKKNDLLFYTQHHNNKLFAKFIGKKKYSEYNYNFNINFFALIQFFYSYKIIKIFIQEGFFLAYSCAIINKINPRVVVTFIDNDYRFYLLKNFNKSIKFISIQNGYRGYFIDFFGNPKLKELSKNNKMKADYIFSYNNIIKKYYNKFVTAKILSIGSFKNNFIRPSMKSGKNLLYISQFRDRSFLNTNAIKDNYIYHYGKKTITWDRYFFSEKKLISILKKFCKKNNLKLVILGCSLKSKDQEKKHFRKILNNFDFKFIKRKNNLSNYYHIDNYKLVVTMFSTLGYESLGRLNKTCFFQETPNELKFLKERCTRFGWPNKFQQSGLNYCNRTNETEISLTLQKIYDMPQSLWRSYALKGRNNLMEFDFNNEILKRELKKIF
tara:strand:- start:162 stop:1346 length:1185 start_codon:yes stop_codon:yes gene_type:complete